MDDEYEDKENDEYEDDYPCNDCSMKDACDGWEAQFCCQLCDYYGNKDCDNCDPWNI